MHVLVVVDEKRLAAGLRNGLETDGFVVDLALNGTDGWSLARQNPYTVILLEVLLPGMNGDEICAALRESGVWTPILMLTARDDAQADGAVLASGADDYLSKPFSYSVLLGRLRALLDRGVRERPAILVAGDLHLDPAAHRARRGEVEVRLTGREQALLECLMRRRGTVVSKREILDHAWDYGFAGHPNIVEVYVRHLRNKLDRPFGCMTIETVRGAGYRLCT